MRYYINNMLWPVIMGLISGFPIAFTAGTLTALLTDYKFNIQTIGLFALVGLPYMFEFFIAAFFDTRKAPFFNGKRRGWVLILQPLIIVSILLLPITIAKGDVSLIAFNAILIATLSAGQDSVINAWRVECIKEENQAKAAASSQFGYRLGMLLSGALALILADKYGWQDAITIVCAINSLTWPFIFFSEDTVKPHSKGFKDSLLICFNAVKDFIDSKPNWHFIILFILFFKLPDVISVSLLTNFLMSLGFSKTEIGTVVKFYGLIATVSGAMFGSVLYTRLGLKKLLIISIVFQAVCNLGYNIQYHIGYDLNILKTVITLDNFAGGVGSTALITYMSLLCINKNFTATQYSMLAAIAGTARVVISAYTGYIVELYGWDVMYIFSCIMAIPSLLLIKQALK